MMQLLTGIDDKEICGKVRIIASPEKKSIHIDEVICYQ